MVIEPLRPEQTPAVARLEILNFSEPWNEEAIRAELENPYSLTLVATDSAKVAGYINAHCVFENAHINTFCVAEEYRRHGIGQMLLRTLCRHAANKGVEEITLEVRKSNHAAISLYTREGYRTVGERKNFYRSPHEDAWILKKLIEKDDNNEPTGMGG